MGSVRLESISKVFKETTAVDDVSLEIEEGEFFSLLGPSGCGKTTTLRMIGGFEDPSSGRIHLSGKDVTSEPPFKRNVNTVFQSYALFPHLDVFENVAYGLKRKKVAGGEIETRVNEMLELVDLPGYAQRKTTQLSGGQQQRVALARALVNRPEVLLLDEPLGALDLKLRKQMQIELKRIQSEVGITFIYVTHDQEEAMTMSNRIAVMNAGRIEQLGPPQEVYELPATSFVASFLGASNLLEGEAQGAEGNRANVRLLTGDVIRVPADRLPQTSGLVTIGIRPEKLTLDASGSTQAASNSVKATVLVSTYTGVSTDYECKTDDGARIVVYVQNLGGGEDLIPEGSKVHLTWDPEHTFVVKKSGGTSTKEDRDG